MSTFPPDSEYEKGYSTRFNPRTKRTMLYVGLYHDETDSQRGEVCLSWPLATELGPSMRVKHDSYHLFEEIPEFFEAMSSFPSDVRCYQIVDWLKTNGYRDFS